MKKSTTSIALAAVGGIGMGAVSPAQADVCTFTPTSGIWASAGNWDCSAEEDIPDSDDHAIIPSGKTCDVDADADAQGLGVSGTLDIASGTTLTLHGVSGDVLVNVQFAGTINLVGSDSVLEFLEDGLIVSEGEAGKIVGADDDAQIILADNTTLTNKVIIEGNLQITEAAIDDATFVNEGTVHANASGTLYINTDQMEDSLGLGQPRWKVSRNSSAVLKLEPTNATAPTLAANFRVENGTLDIQATVNTTGDLSQTGGTISVADGAVLQFNAPT